MREAKMIEEGGFPPSGWKVLKRNPDGGCYLLPQHLVDDTTPRHLRPRRELPKPAPKPKVDWNKIQGEFYSFAHCDRIEELSNDLGIKEAYLRVVGLGWCEGKKAWSFPMYRDPDTVIGIRLRTDDGAKFAIKGSSAGVFMNPVPMNNWEDEEVAYICEGPTDTASAFQLGLYAIGRPSASGGIDILKKLLRGKRTVIISDDDSPGRQGADNLAEALKPIVPSVKIIQPLKKDIREWLQHGATRDDVIRLVNNAKEWQHDTRTWQVQSQPT